MRALIELSADVNKAMDTGETPLVFAAQKGHEAVARLLIEAGADIIKAEDGDGTRRRNTPLHVAAREGHEAVARLLIETDPDNIDNENDYDETPLCIAAQKGHYTLVQLLVKARAYVNCTDRDGWAILSNVASDGHETIARALMEAGADGGGRRRQR